MRKFEGSFIREVFKTMISSLVLAIPFSYFLAKFFLRLQDPLEAFLATAALTFLYGFIRKHGTLNYIIYRSLSVFLFSMVFTAFITAFALVYPFTALEFDISQIYPEALIRIITWPFGYLFFSMGVAFMLLGSALSAVNQREEKAAPILKKWSV